MSTIVDRLRYEIQQADAVILAALAKRLFYTQQLGEYKVTERLNIINPVVEQQNRTRLQAARKPHVPAYLVDNVFDAIVDASLHQQYTLKRRAAASE